MDKETGKFTTRVRKPVRPRFAQEKHQTALFNMLLIKYYKKTPKGVIYEPPEY